MTLRCETCGKSVTKLVPIGDARRSAEESALLEVPHPCTDYVCITCARKTIGITDEDLIHEERLRERETEFRLLRLKGCLGQVVVETIFQEFGYEVYPYGYESYLTNIIKFMRKGDANIAARKMRLSPDLFVYDREYNDGFFLEVKSTTTPDETNWWIAQSTLRQYKIHWPESILVIYCIPSMNIYCRSVDEILVDELAVEQSPVTGYDNYVINLEQDFQILPERFRLIDSKGYEEFRERVRKVVSQFGELRNYSV